MMCSVAFGNHYRGELLIFAFHAYIENCIYSIFIFCSCLIRQANPNTTEFVSEYHNVCLMCKFIFFNVDGLSLVAV